jgi:hypothetical protein
MVFLLENMTVIPEIMKAGTNNFVSGHPKGTNSTMLHKRTWFDEEADGPRSALAGALRQNISLIFTSMAISSAILVKAIADTNCDWNKF